MVITRPNSAWRDVVKVLSAMKNDKHNYKSPVKPLEIIAIVGIVGIMILISIQSRHTKPLTPASPVDVDHLDRRTAMLAALDDAQLVPGKSVGKIHLGEEAPDINIILGPPQLGDAAMCKSWSRWQWGDPLHVLEVFESCDPKKDMKKTVQQIRFSGIPYETHDGISLKSTFEKIQETFAGLKAVATFKDKTTGKQMIIMDQKRDGIAFVFNSEDNQPQGNCQMIIVHQRGQDAISTYLQPEWTLHPLE
jgi:hypothetical protein